MANIIVYIDRFVNSETWWKIIKKTFIKILIYFFVNALNITVIYIRYIKLNIFLKITCLKLRNFRIFLAVTIPSFMRYIWEDIAKHAYLLYIDLFDDIYIYIYPDLRD